MYDSPIFPMTISVFATQWGLLMCYRPQSWAQVLLKRVASTAMLCSIVFMTFSLTIICGRSGGFFALVFEPTGRDFIIPNPWGYYVRVVFAAVKTACFSAAFVCSLLYLAKSWLGHGAFVSKPGFD